MDDPEPSVAPDHLLRALRAFVACGAGAAAAEGKEAPETAQAEGTDAEPLGWEEAGSLVWDVAALPDDAAFLLRHGLPAMLPPLLAATAAREEWRQLEIGLGVAANLACHDDGRRQLLQLPDFPALLLDRVLWVDESACLVEACRCAAALLAGAEHEDAERWWALVLREETLGRLVWIIENTLSSALLERALNLLGCLVTAAGAAKASGDASKARLVPLLGALGLLPLLASVLHGWVVKQRAERQPFEGNNSHGAGDFGEHAGGSSGGQQRQGGAAAAEPSEPNSPLAPDDAGGAGEALETDAEAGGAVAAEVTVDAVLEALALLEALAAQEMGEIALNASAPTKDALLRTLAESEHHNICSLAESLLASLEGVGPQLLAQPAALSVVLLRLSDAARSHPEKRLKVGAGSGSVSAAVAAIRSAEERAEEAEAGWALCSALAKALGTGGAAAAGPEDAMSKQGPALAALLPHVADVLCHDWGSNPRAAAIQAHQAYVLRQLLAATKGAGGEWAARRAAMQAALERCEAAVASL